MGVGEPRIAESDYYKYNYSPLGDKWRGGGEADHLRTYSVGTSARTQRDGMRQKLHTVVPGVGI